MVLQFFEKGFCFPENSRPHPERISYHLTGISAPKNVPKKQRVELFLKRKKPSLMNLLKISVLTNPTTTNVERWFSVCNSSFDWTTKYFGAKLIRQTDAINFNGTPYDLDRGEITDLEKFLKKPHSMVLSWCNLTIHI